MPWGTHAPHGIGYESDWLSPCLLVMLAVLADPHLLAALVMAEALALYDLLAGVVLCAVAVMLSAVAVAVVCCRGCRNRKRDGHNTGDER